MKAFWLVLLLLTTLPARAEYAFLAKVVKVESDFGYPFQTVRLTYEVPCDAMVSAYIENKSDTIPPEFAPELGVMLTVVSDCALPGLKLEHHVFHFRSYPGLRPRILNARHHLRIQQLHYGATEIH